MNKLPKVIKNYNIYFQDSGYGGICSEVELPDLELKSEEFRGGGMDMGMAIDLGMEIPTIGFTMEEHVAAVMRKFGSNSVQGRFAAAKTNGRDGVERYTIEFSGAFHQMPLGTVAAGDKSPMKGTIKCDFLNITMNGSPIAKIDALGGIREIGGIDQLAEVMSAIG